MVYTNKNSQKLKSLQLENPNGLPFHDGLFLQSHVKLFHKILIKTLVIKSFRKLLTKILFYKSFFEVPNTAKYLKAFKNCVCSYTVEVLNPLDPAIQLSITKTHVKNKLRGLLVEIKCFKIEIMLQVTLHKKIGNSETTYPPQIYFPFKSQTVVNDLDIDNSIKTSQTILSRIQKWLGESSGWSTDSECIKIHIYNPLVGNSYIQLLEELKHSSKSLISIQNDVTLKSNE